MLARLAKISVLAAVALAVAASSGAAAGRARTPILGVVPHASQPAVFRASGPAPAQNRLAEAANRSAAPATLTFDPKYQTVINTYLADVAHDSSGTNNVYSVATQYTDGSGAVRYTSAFGGSYVAHDPLPPNGCDDTANGLHDPYCVTDQQLEAEIQSVLAATGWRGGLDHMFFLITPNGVGSCFDAAGQCSTDTFCAYHSAFTDSSNETVVYANEPYEGPYPGCTGTGSTPAETQGFPNDVDADTTVNTISHEHNEAITDPLGTAWYANDGNQDENGDLCAYGFGQQTGTGAAAYNQVINGHHYDLQQEYSNGGGGGCVQHIGGPASSPTLGSGPLAYHGGPVMHTNTTYAIYWLPTARNTGAPLVTGTAAVNQALSSSAGTWAMGGAPFAYQWQRCSSGGTGCVDIPGATAATYRPTAADGGHVVRSTVRATNVNGLSQPAASTGTSAVIDVPAATKAPHVSGRARVGKKLTGGHGSWTYSPTYRYQWLRCDAHGGSCSSIHNATHTTYRLTKRDARHTLRLRVTATNVAGSGTATSAASARVRR